MWWPGRELNPRRQPFQGCALPPELPGHISIRSHCRTRPSLTSPGLCAGFADESNSHRGSVRNDLDYSNGSAILSMPLTIFQRGTSRVENCCTLRDFNGFHASVDEKSEARREPRFFCFPTAIGHAAA